MGTSVFFGNPSERELRLRLGDMEKIGIRTSGPVLSGKASVDEALRITERLPGESLAEFYLRLGKQEKSA